MDGETFWMAATGIMSVACLIVGELRYRAGIWDGAFNRFLPRVQAEMRRYDRDRAERILDADKRGW